MARLVSPAHLIATHGIESVVDALGEAFGRPLAQAPRVARAQLRALSRYDVGARRDALRTVRALVVSGSDDLIAPPRFGRRLATGIGARFVELPGASHALTIQQAAAVNTLLRAHFRGEGADGAHRRAKGRPWDVHGW